MAFTTNIVGGNREYTKRDALFMTDTANAKNINTVMEKEGSLRLSVNDYAEVQVHNDASKENKDYTNYIYVDENGNKYYTGSSSFHDAFMRIYEMMEGEPFEVDVVQIPSKNYAGRNVLSCTIV